MIQPIKTIKWTPTKIRELRLKYGLSQREMAAIVGVSQQLIQRLESGEHVIKRMTKIAWDRIAEHLKESRKISG